MAETEYSISGTYCLQYSPLVYTAAMFPLLFFDVNLDASMRYGCIAKDSRRQ